MKVLNLMLFTFFNNLIFFNQVEINLKRKTSKSYWAVFKRYHILLPCMYPFLKSKVVFSYSYFCKMLLT